MDIHFPAVLRPQMSGGYFVEFPDLPDTFTDGESEEAALFNAAEVLTAMLDWHLDNDQTIPEPSEGVPGARLIAPDTKTQAALGKRLVLAFE